MPLQDANPTPSFGGFGLNEIQRAAGRGANLTRQLLAFSRRQITQPMVVNLNDLIASTSEMLRRLIGEDVELVILLDPDLGMIKVDPSQMEQVLVNLSVQRP